MPQAIGVAHSLAKWSNQSVAASETSQRMECSALAGQDEADLAEDARGSVLCHKAPVQSCGP